jgi:hypothetical protein
MGKEEVMAFVRYYICIYLERLRKTIKTLPGYLVSGFEPTSLDYKAEALITQQQWLVKYSALSSTTIRL